MNATHDRFQVVTSHGEGATVYYAVDSAAPEAEQPAIVRSWSTRDDGKGASALWLARDFCARQNAKESASRVCPVHGAYPAGPGFCCPALPPSPAAGGAK